MRSATTVTGGSSKSKTAALNQISALLPSLSGLQSLSLSGMGIGPRGIKLVLGILTSNNNSSGSGSCCPQLTELNVSGCRIGFFGAKEISSIGLPLTLTRLDIHNNEFFNKIDEIENKNAEITLKDEKSKNKSINDVIKIYDAKVVNLGIEFSIVCDKRYESTTVLLDAIQRLKDKYTEKFYVGEPI